MYSINRFIDFSNDGCHYKYMEIAIILSFKTDYKLWKISHRKAHQLTTTG